MELQSSVRTGWWQQLTVPTGELILPTLKGCIFDLSIDYQMKCKIIPVQASPDPEGSRSLRLPDFETVCKWKWSGCQPYVPAAITPKEIFLVFISVRGWVDNRVSEMPEVSCQWKLPWPSRIQTATFRPLANWLNKPHHSQSECKRDSESVMCKKTFSQILSSRRKTNKLLDPFYILSNTLWNSHIEFERMYFLCALRY